MGKRSSLPLLFLLALDLACFALHVSHDVGWIDDARFRLDLDRGYAEWLQYLKALTAAALLWMRGTTLMRTWAVLFVYIAIDDALRVHEVLGGTWIGHGLGLPRGYHTGQVLYAGLVVAAFAGALWRSWGTAGDDDRRRSWTLAAALAAFGLAGVVLDFVYSALLRGTLDLLFVLLEDGGEHVVLSVIVWITTLPVHASEYDRQRADRTPAWKELSR